MSQMEQIKKMGDLKTLMNMIPGMSKALKDVDIDNNALKKVECIVLSMTPNERANPELVLSTKKRKERIARGSGKTFEEVNAFCKQFDQMKQMMHQFSTGKFPGAQQQKGGFRR